MNNPVKKMAAFLPFHQIVKAALQVGFNEISQ